MVAIRIQMAARSDVIAHRSMISLVKPNHTVPEGQTRTANADMATPIRPITTLMT